MKLYVIGVNQGCMNLPLTCRLLVQISSSLLTGDILVDGHVLLEACEPALSLHGGQVLGLKVDDALLIAYAVRLI